MIQRFQDADILKGLLVFAPFYMGVSSMFLGLKLGMISFTLILLLVLIIFISRKLIVLPQQQLAFVIIVSISLISIMRMLLEAEAYSFVNAIGIFLPLLVINSFILSVNESVFSMSGMKAVMVRAIKVALAALLFFFVFGFIRELLSDVSFFTSSAGFLFLAGFLFALMNFLNEKRINN